MTRPSSRMQGPRASWTGRSTASSSLPSRSRAPMASGSNGFQASQRRCCTTWGKQAKAHKRIRCEGIPLPPGCGCEHLEIVADFKHVGTYVSAAMFWAKDTSHRIGSAAGAYQPISGKYLLAIHFRPHFACSLVTVWSDRDRFTICR